MSMTTWCGPSAAVTTSTSTAYVAPWSFCAGPKKRSAKLCAIITWSETPSVNIPSVRCLDCAAAASFRGSIVSIRKYGLNRFARQSGEASIGGGCVSEGDGRVDEHVETRVFEQRQDER